MMKRLLINLCFLFAIFPSCIAQQRTPTMGWSSWNTYSADSQQTVVAELKKGENTVRLHNDHERMPDVDYLLVETK